MAVTDMTAPNTQVSLHHIGRDIRRDIFGDLRHILFSIRDVLDSLRDDIPPINYFSVENVLLQRVMFETRTLYRSILSDRYRLWFREARTQEEELSPRRQHRQEKKRLQRDYRRRAQEKGRRQERLQGRGSQRAHQARMRAMKRR